jgi:hypothetical protein
MSFISWLWEGDMEFSAAAFLKLLQTVPGLARFVGPIIDRRRLRLIAEDLSSLAFWNGGMRGPLEMLANGQGGDKELAQISIKLKESEKDVQAVIRRLNSAAEGLVATDFGMPVARALEKLTYKKIGPNAIRAKLIGLPKKNRGDPNIKRAAQNLVSEIDQFDSALNELHEQIRPKKAIIAGTVKKAGAKKKE